MAVAPERGEGDTDTSAAPVLTPGSPQELTHAAPYEPLPPAPVSVVHLDEPLPPEFETKKGYWVTARLMRVYPHDKIQFQHATIFFNGHSMFSRPLYVASLAGGFNPASDILSLNSEGGPTINIPFYYQASPHGTGTFLLERAPTGGFATQDAGLSAALDEQYWLAPGSQGRLTLDQLGRGNWDLDWQHSLQLSPTMNASVYLDMPDHVNQYLRTSLLKEFPTMEVGMEGFYNNTQGGTPDEEGQFFARMRPKMIGNTGWSYSFGGNFMTLSSFAETYESDGPGGGNGVPTVPFGPHYATRLRPALGQSFDATFQGPNYNLWKNGRLQAAVLGTAYNYSDGQRGLSPGARLGVQQKFGNTATLGLDYDYDRGSLSVLGQSFTDFVNSNLAVRLSKSISTNTSISKSMVDGSVYGSTELDYYLASHWRVGLESDYAHFPGTDPFLSYGWTIGHMIGSRELTFNWDNYRHQLYFELGGFRY